MNIKFSIIFIFFSTICLAQFQLGVVQGFSTYQEFQDGNPTLHYTLQLKQGNAIDMLGGIGEFNLKKIKPVSHADEVYRRVWGLEIDGITYINVYPHTNLKGFNEIIEYGYYKYFLGIFPQNPRVQKELGMNIPKLKWGKSLTGHVGFVLLPNGKIKYLGPELLAEICSDNKVLSEEITKANLEIFDVYEIYEFLKRYNQSK